MTETTSPARTRRSPAPPAPMVRGEGSWLFDARGRRHLDADTEAAVLGHGHPRVAEAVARQAAAQVGPVEDHPLTGTLLERLLALMPPGGPDRALLTTSGGEATDRALRVAAEATGATGVIVTRSARHGHTLATAACSPGAGRPVGPHVRVVDPPRPGETDAAVRVAHDVNRAVRRLRKDGFGVSALLIDPLLTSDGLVPGPIGFLTAAAEAVRAFEALVILDETGSAPGRSGHLFAFERHPGLLPDVVTLGSALGNGHPLGVTLVRSHAASGVVDEGAGALDPVAAAAGLAVLDALAAERLVAQAGRTGARLVRALRRGLRVGTRSAPGVVDLRAAGLVIAVELAPGARTTAARRALRVANAMRRSGVRVGVGGRQGEVLLLRPPLTIGPGEVERLAQVLVREVQRVPWAD